MYRVTGSTLGTVAIGIVAVVLVAGIVGGGLFGAPHSASGLNAKGSPAGSAGAHAAPLVPAAQTYQTTIDLSFNTSLPYEALPAITATPTSYTLYSNVTYGTISNADTSAWAVVTNSTFAKPIAISLNGTVNAANVHSFVNNGVPYQNYTWTLALSESTLGCTVASCADLFPAGGLDVVVTVYMTENVASLGGGLASTSTFGDTLMVSTYVTAGFDAPASALAAVPFAVEFWTNISWGYTSNASTSVNLAVSYAAVNLNFSWNGSVNATNSHEFSSAVVFNGTVAGVPYTEYTWSMVLNKTTLGCSTTSCNTTFGMGTALALTVWVNESGTSAGGLASTTEMMATTVTVTAGSTLINGGDNGFPLAYQPLPYTQTGWLNVSWVNPATDQGNTSISGYFLVFEDPTIIAITLNNSVNTTTADGVSLSYAHNGTTAMGIPFLNYTWSISLSAVAGSLGGTVPYTPTLLAVNITANGNQTGQGGWTEVLGLTPILESTFVQYPTTVSAALTSVCPVTGPCSPTFTAYEPTPFTVNYTITVGNAPISPASTFILVNITDLATGNLITSTPVTPAPGQSAYQFGVNSVSLACTNPSCSDLPQDEFGINVAVVVDGISLPTNGSLAYANVSHGFFLITVPLSASLVSPVPGASVSVGNVTTSVAYLGSWIAGVALNIYSSSGALVFSHSFIELTPGVPVSEAWLAGSTGTYTYSIVVTTVYLPSIHYFNGTISVITKGGTVYLNESKWSNQTVLPGLSGATSGTLLLIVGLIVGMIVALIFGRAIWGGRPASQPPQAWEGKPGEQPGAAGTNTCSVCGKSFATPDELAAHGKSEHGMQ